MTFLGYPYLQELLYFFLGRINGPNIVWVKNESCMRGISPLVDLHRKGSTAKPPANPILSLVCPVWLVWKSNGWDHRCIYIHCWGVSGFQWPLGCFDVFPRRKTQLQNVPCAFTQKDARCDFSAYEPPFPLNPDMFALYEIYMRDVRLLGDVPMLSLAWFFVKKWGRWWGGLTPWCETIPQEISMYAP